MSVACGKCTVEVAVRRRDRQAGRETDNGTNVQTDSRRDEQAVRGTAREADKDTGRETEDKQTVRLTERQANRQRPINEVCQLQLFNCPRVKQNP